MNSRAEDSLVDERGFPTQHPPLLWGPPNPLMLET
jgi:hypothetical protein